MQVFGSQVRRASSSTLMEAHQTFTTLILTIQQIRRWILERVDEPRPDVGHPPVREQLVEPATIHAVLERWLKRPRSEWTERGRRCRAFVERWHDPDRIARDVADDYRAARSGTSA